MLTHHSIDHDEPRAVPLRFVIAVVIVLGIIVGAAAAADCNMNGIPDEQEIFQFLEPDCNMNGILDECELSDCCAAHPSAGCSTAACEALVCELDADCCDIAWEPSCASLAAQFCPELCSAPPATDCDRDGTLDECECCGDSDGNGAVDIDDIVAVVLDFGTAGELRGGDVDGSGLVDIDDVVLVVLRWGDCPPVPCPPQDYWSTSPDEVTTITFGGQDVDPIPAGFFGPGSDPFEGQVAMVGVTLDDERWPQVDTIIERSARVDLVTAPIGWQETVGVRIKGLSLMGTAPIVVSGEAWAVFMDLADGQPPGTMTVSKTSPTGGDVQMQLPVRPRISFARQSDLVLLREGQIGGADVETRILDWAHEGRPPIVMSWPVPMPWSTQPGEGYACPGETFFPGVDPIRPAGGPAAPLALSPLTSAHAELVHWLSPPLTPIVHLCRISITSVTGCSPVHGQPECDLTCVADADGYETVGILCDPALGCEGSSCGITVFLRINDCAETNCICYVWFMCATCE